MNLFLSVAAIFGLTTLGHAQHSGAATPPMGWNSYNVYGDSVNEQEIMANAEVMKTQLLPYGWEYIVVDYRWYDPGAHSSNLRDRDKALLSADVFGRLEPAPSRFPSSAGGKGFKPLADKLHAMGLKFGIHIMRGIPRQAVLANTPIEGSVFKAAEAADTKSICSWNPDMYGVDAAAPAGQAWYDSIFRQYAAWDVDFIKVDDLSYPYSTLEIEAVRKAIVKCGRPMVFSTSPGETPVNKAGHIKANANMWRISGDFWDKWEHLRHSFDLLAQWQGQGDKAHWPDADMIPFGYLSKRNNDGGQERKTRFTPNEQRTLMTLWCIAKSPLMLGADLTRLDDWTLSVLNNDEVLEVNQKSINNRQIFNRDGWVAWIADVPGSKDKYLALFNKNDNPHGETITIHFKDAGIASSSEVRDLWTKKDLGLYENEFSFRVEAHGAMLVRLLPRSAQ